MLNKSFRTDVKISGMALLRTYPGTPLGGGGGGEGGIRLEAVFLDLGWKKLQSRIQDKLRSPSY